MDASALASLWRRMAPGRSGSGGDAGRWVVIDTETTGLDPARDAMIAIGGVAVGPGGVRVEDSFESVVRHDGPVDRGNVVIHGLGREAQLAGVAPDEALQGFIDWVGDAPLIAYHAPFDRAVIEVAAARAGIRFPRRPWLDVAPLAAALAPEGVSVAGAGLDTWLQVHRIPCTARHNAAADALATAELLVKLRRLVSPRGSVAFGQLARLERNGRWLARA